MHSHTCNLSSGGILSVITTSARRFQLLVVGAVAALLSPIADVSATTFNIQSDRSTYIFSANPTSNQGGLSNGTVGEFLGTREGLVGFDVSSLNLNGEPVQSVTLTLFASYPSFVAGSGGYNTLPAGSLTAEVHAISDANADWVAGTGTNAVVAGQSSWTSAQQAIQLWAGSAGLSTGGVGLSTPGIDYDNTTLATTTVTPYGLHDPFVFTFTGTSADLTALINHWQQVQNGGLLITSVPVVPNNYFGFVFNGPGASPFLPELSITTVPEPSTMGLLIGGLATLFGVALKGRNKAA